MRNLKPFFWRFYLTFRSRSRRLALLASLAGQLGCDNVVPVGADAGRLHFRGQILAVDGSQSFATERSGPAREAAVMGHEAAEELLARAGPDFLAV